MEPVKPKPWHTVKGLKKKGDVAGLLHYALIPVTISMAADGPPSAMATLVMPAIQALAQIGTPDAVRALVEISVRGDSVRGCDAIRYLAEVGLPEAADALMETLTNGKPFLQGAAAEGLEGSVETREFSISCCRAHSTPSTNGVVDSSAVSAISAIPERSNPLSSC